MQLLTQNTQSDVTKTFTRTSHKLQKHNDKNKNYDEGEDKSLLRMLFKHTYSAMSV